MIRLLDGDDEEFDPVEALEAIAELDEKVRKYFGATPRWAYLPLDDMTDVKWTLSGFGHKVVWCASEYDLADCIVNETHDYYDGVIVDDPIEKGDYVLIGVDTQSDGNQFLMLFRLDHKVELDEETQEYL